jgi:outer membrane immunogenic protein
MRKLLVVSIAAFGVLALVGAAWAIVGETTVTATGGGQPIPGAKVTLTFKTDTGRVIKRTTTRRRKKIVIPDGTRRVDITVRTRRGTKTETDVDVGLLVGREYPVEIPGGGPPGTPSANDPSGPMIGGGVGTRTTACTDWHTRRIVTFNIPDPLGQNPDECMSTGVRGSIYVGTSTRVQGNWLVGAEAEIGWGSNSKSVPGIPGSIAGVPGVTPAVAANDQTKLKETWDFSLRGRLGHYVTPSTVVYGTGGFAMMSVEASVSCAANGACGINGIPAFSETQRKTLTGWTAGGGVETALTDRWVARIEYRYSDYGTWTTTFGTPANFAVTTDITMRTHTATVGVAYKLGP